MDVAQRFQELRAFDGNLHCNTRPIRRWKSRAAQRRAAAFETRKARSKLDLIEPLGGAQGGADGPPAQEMRDAVPHVLREDFEQGGVVPSHARGGN
jgi:hypothetical protein